MANRFVLFPEANYKALISEKEKPLQQGGASIDDDLQELSGLKFVKKKLGQLKKIKKKNVSAKNVLYNQRLRAYLKLRKQIRDKPVGINLTKQGPKLVSKGTEMALLNDQGDAIPAIKPDYGVPEKPKPAIEAGFFTPPSKIISPKPNSAKKSEVTPISNRQQKRLEKEEAKQQLIVDKASKLKEILLKNPTKYNITSSGDILNPSTFKIVGNSDIDKSINRLVNPTLANAPSPPGTRYLKRLITEDKEAVKLIYPYQEGKGKWQKIKIKKNKKNQKLQTNESKINEIHTDKLDESIKKKINKIYTNLKYPGSFSGEAQIYNDIKQKYPFITKNDVRNFLESNRTYTLFKNRRLKFPRSKFVPLGYMTSKLILDLYFFIDLQVDLADFQALAEENDDNHFLLIAVDVFSRMVFGSPILSKKGQDVIIGFERIFNSMPHLPSEIFHDRGKEFLNKEVKEYLRDKGIHQFSSATGDTKAAVAERFIRTVK